MIHLRTGLHALLALATSSAVAQETSGPSLSEPPLVTIEEAAGAPPEQQEEEGAGDGQKAIEEGTPSAVRVHPWGPSLLTPGEEATLLARSELVVGQTIHGIGQGLLVCSAAACESPQSWTSALVIGAGVGLGASALGTWGGVTGGPAAAINSGSAWGFVEGAWIMWLFQEMGLLEAAPGLLAATSIAGTGLGVAAALFLHPTGGQVALVNSGGIWTSLLAFLVVWPWVSSFTPQTLPAIELVATNVGLAGLALLSARIEVSRGRMFLIDVAGLLGMLLGYTAHQFAGLAPSTPYLAPMMAAGTVAGLAAGIALTSGIDARSPAKVALVPGGPKGTPGAFVFAAF